MREVALLSAAAAAALLGCASCDGSPPGAAYALAAGSNVTPP